MDYTESLAYLGKIQEDGAKFSLDKIQIIIEHLPFDLRKIGFIQVGGTNGKGSTSHGISAVLSRGGYRVGLFTSPHLFDLRERIALGKEWISQSAFATCMTQVARLVDDLTSRGIIPTRPSFFEHMLLTALTFFHQEKVDFAVLEVGLGGRLDATTAIKPLVSVITNVNYDHLKILGRTLSAIAAEKAGIIKPGIPVVCACQPKTAGYRVIKTRAGELSAPFEPVFSPLHQLSLPLHAARSPVFTYSTPEAVHRFTPGMPGQHQGHNAAAIIRTVQVLNRLGITNIDQSAIEQGIADNRVPGRLEWFNTHPPILIDGGHNAAGIRSLTAYLKEVGLGDLTLVFGVLKDKQYRSMIREILPFTGRVILTEPQSHRAISAHAIAPLFSPLKPLIIPDYQEALEKAIAAEKTVLITGSLYLIGEMRDRILTRLQHSSMEVPS
jgi:dihydrofolate synthase/folylpolyglutamate synthase